MAIYPEDIHRELDKERYIVATYLDIKIAFVTVDHNKLVELLEELGIRGTVNT